MSTLVIACGMGNMGPALLQLGLVFIGIPLVATAGVVALVIHANKRSDR